MGKIFPIRPLSHLWDRDAGRRGNVAMLFAFMMPLIVGSAGFAVETTYWFYKGTELQTAADAAAFAAALEKRAGSNDAKVTTVATTTATANGFDDARGDIQIDTTPSSGNGVEVVLTGQADRFFTAMFISDDVALGARAVASFNVPNDACILALNQTAERAVEFAGNTDMSLRGCSVMSNSNANNAVSITGNAMVEADCLKSAGGIVGALKVTVTECPAVVTDAPRVDDPFEDIPTPVRPAGACQVADKAPKIPYTIDPGRYCNLELGGTTTLSAGVYYVEGNFTINSNSVIRGDDVTIYVTSGGRASLNGNANIQLHAPTTGEYAGVLFYGDRIKGINPDTNKFNGNAGSIMSGAIYFPTQAIEYSGNFSGSSGCTRVVGDMVSWSGNSEVTLDCRGSDEGAVAASRVRLTQ